MKKITEAVDIKKAIKDFIDTNWSKNEKEAGQAIQILKGLVFSDDSKAKQFIKDLDKLSNTMDVSKYQESVTNIANELTKGENTMRKVERGMIESADYYKTYTLNDYIRDIEFYVSLPLKDLRRRQDISDQQMQKAYASKDDIAMRNLELNRQLLTAAVDIKEFKDSTPKEWAKDIMKRFNESTKGENTMRKVEQEKETIEIQEEFQVPGTEIILEKGDRIEVLAETSLKEESLGILRKEAEEATEFRGHDIVWAAPWHGEGKSLQNGECTRCGAEVQINSNPAPNEIDISGEAVAINCT